MCGHIVSVVGRPCRTWHERCCCRRYTRTLTRRGWKVRAANTPTCRHYLIGRTKTTATTTTTPTPSHSRRRATASPRQPPTVSTATANHELTTPMEDHPLLPVTTTHRPVLSVSNGLYSLLINVNLADTLTVYFWALSNSLQYVMQR